MYYDSVVDIHHECEVSFFYEPDLHSGMIDYDTMILPYKYVAQGVRALPSPC